MLISTKVKFRLENQPESQTGSEKSPNSNGLKNTAESPWGSCHDFDFSSWLDTEDVTYHLGWKYCL